jgi:alpha-beta hydrolase superfamily lysophospholipase
MIESQRVSFGKCVGRLFLEEGTSRLPCVVLAHGFSGTMDRLFDVAEYFARHGLAALVFDYRGFGESGGEPRQTVDVPGQLADLRAAVAFVRGQGRVDPTRVALWGNSLGGAHAIVAASGDPTVRAVVAQIPFNGFPKKVEGRSRAEAMRLMGVILVDAFRGALGLKPKLIPMIGGPGQVAVTSTADAQAYLELLGGKSTTWRNEVAPRGLLKMMRYRPARAAARLRAPLLVCAAESDRAAPLELTRQLCESAPRGELTLDPGGHFDFYQNPAVRMRVMKDQAAFLKVHLGSGG